ncbi:N-acetyltransferase [Candidatus Kaiserbacteria bacterium]|nr:N-acetyltransferase [Candidatus Kaiserbacteria bacterium]
MENILIRTETPREYRETENVVREAFWDVYKPGCDEHLIIHKLRQSPDFIAELDFVACDGDDIVGVAICPKAKIISDQGQEFTVLSMLVGVLPSHQKKGIGSMLINRVIEAARSLGHKGIVIFGDPKYYPRFGFRNAMDYGIQTSDGQNLDPFMALELGENSLDGIRGRFHEAPAFQPIRDSAELAAFDMQFPPKEKHVTDTQLK